VEVRRITINGRTYVLVQPDTAARMLREIEDAARTGPRWVTTPVGETNPPQVLITPNVDCVVEVLDIPDEDPAGEGAAHAFHADWPFPEFAFPDEEPHGSADSSL